MQAEQTLGGRTRHRRLLCNPTDTIFLSDQQDLSADLRHVVKFDDMLIIQPDAAIR